MEMFNLVLRKVPVTFAIWAFMQIQAMLKNDTILPAKML